MPRCDHHWVPAQPIPRCSRCGAQPTCSPTQIETAQLCLRKWAYSRRAPREQTAAAAYGDRCHDLLEAWGKRAAQPDNDTPEGRTVLSVLEFCPAPQTALHEHRVTATLGGVPWDMRLDVIDGFVAGAFVSIADLKTTGDFKWMKAPDELATTDPQGIVYGHWAVETFDVPRAIGRWIYGLRVPAKGKHSVPPRGRVVPWTSTRPELAARFEPIARLAYTLAWLRLFDRTPEVFPRSLGEPCEKFGGCSYRKECHADVSPLDLAAAQLYTLRGG